jgi:hydroxylaminobenzene mutase
VRLGLRAKAIAYWTALYGTYVNWLFTVLAAVFGTGAVSPILAPGRSGQAWQEGLVMAGFVSVFVAMLTSSVLVLWGPSGQSIGVSRPRSSRVACVRPS